MLLQIDGCVHDLTQQQIPLQTLLISGGFQHILPHAPEAEQRGTSKVLKELRSSVRQTRKMEIESAKVAESRAVIGKSGNISEADEQKKEVSREHAQDDIFLNRRTLCDFTPPPEEVGTEGRRAEERRAQENQRGKKKPKLKTTKLKRDEILPERVLCFALFSCVKTLFLEVHF